jgi:hypothetical protein
MAGVTINKATYQHSSLEIDIAVLGESWGIIEGFDDVEYSDSVEREKSYGASRTPVDFTDGEYDAEGSITFHQYVLDYLIAKCKEKGVGFYDVEMTLTINRRKNADSELHTDTLTRVMFSSTENSSSTGPESIMVPCDLFIGGLIFRDGLGPFGEKLE